MTRTKMIVVRVTERERVDMLREAKSHGLALSAWVRLICRTTALGVKRKRNDRQSTRS